ncbi:single-stranded DNA-binding protein [Texcoconibacillus texcoconensis]|uniref:Single-stranded DNA-binding protein n=1 Tax=Texcoconibacillus texcoconensis TaxID=1095777 RepID=A0A840QPZ0_9BACI|nr:single-stranded DNA-binding protein [Texcoconibacillus texcoconensis]MBB5173419.1 single-strand DNA-binding protein [Texcoconibacillus texcoconensis]
MVNQITLIGRLVRDPDMYYTKSGIPLTRFSLAVKRSFRNQNGEYATDFIPCTAWRKTAENTSQYCEQGSLIAVNGRIQSRSYENSEQRRVYVTEIIAESVQFIQTQPANKKHESSSNDSFPFSERDRPGDNMEQDHPQPPPNLPSPTNHHPS